MNLKKRDSIKLIFSLFFLYLTGNIIYTKKKILFSNDKKLIWILNSND